MANYRKSYKLMGCEFKADGKEGFKGPGKLSLYFDSGFDEETRAVLEIDGEEQLVGDYRKAQGQALISLARYIRGLAPLFEEKGK